MASSTTQGDASTDYWPLHIARSDGQSWDGFPGNSHALSPDDDQDVTQLERWEVIIGGHLQNQAGPRDDKRQYKLAGFPRGYELRSVHRNNDSRDYYLYGHPTSSKATYRTPGEFALHALWLISDSTDVSQCPCDLCSKYKPVRAVNQPPAAAAATSLPSSAAAAAAPAPAPASAPRPAAVPQPSASVSRSATMTTTQQMSQQQMPQQQMSQPQMPQQPPPPPGTTSWTNVFRVGELVWYKHMAWRLGVVIDITPKPGTVAHPGASDSSYHFTLAPLGHAQLEQPTLIKDCQSMRPFLTFSVPNAGMDELRDKTFDMVNWSALTARLTLEPDPAKREVDRQVLGLEASKMGARAINDAFSTFDLLAQGTSPDGAVRIQHYGGLYLGAELIRVGDPIRVTVPQPDSTAPPLPADANPVMLISEIQILTAISPPGGAPARGATVHFRGNLYRTVRSHTTHPLPQGAVPADSLPPAFAEELALRNAIERDKTMRWSWALVSAAAGPVRCAEPDVQGRFYVTDKLMSVIDPGKLQEWVQRGVLEEAPAYLNNRTHSGSGQFAGRRMGRRAMLSEAVGVEFRVPLGMVEN